MEIGTIHIVLTTYCNLGCKGCYQDEKEILNKKEDFNLNDHKENIKFLFNKFITENKQVKISFFGGEPLLKINNIKKVIRFLKKEKLLPDMVSIPTSGGPNQNLVDSGLELIKFIKKTLPETTLNFSLSHDGPVSLETRNQTLDNLNNSFRKIYALEKEIDKITPNIVLNLLPQVIEEDYLTKTNDYLLYTIEKVLTFRIPHLLQPNSNLDTNKFQQACRIFLDRFSNSDIENLPKIFKDYYDRMISPLPERNVDYNWCQAGVNHFALTNIKDKTFTGCEYLNKDSLELYNQMSNECNNCPINYYCSKPCLKSIEVSLNQFKRHCSVRKIIFNEVRRFLNIRRMNANPRIPK